MLKFRLLSVISCSLKQSLSHDNGTWKQNFRGEFDGRRKKNGMR